jgi:tRNA 2-thiouridine synthesizing protein E
MPETTIHGHTIHVNDEGFLTDPSEWDEDLAKGLAEQIGIDLTDEHWKAIKFMREDYSQEGETPTLRRIQANGGIATKTMFQLFPQKPAKKASYIAGLPKPHGCV